eukprot:gene11117-18739_t
MSASTPAQAVHHKVECAPEGRKRRLPTITATTGFTHVSERPASHSHVLVLEKRNPPHAGPPGRPGGVSRVKVSAPTPSQAGAYTSESPGEKAPSIATTAARQHRAEGSERQVQPGKAAKCEVLELVKQLKEKVKTAGTAATASPATSRA